MKEGSETKQALDRVDTTAARRQSQREEKSSLRRKKAPRFALQRPRDVASERKRSTLN